MSYLKITALKKFWCIHIRLSVKKMGTAPMYLRDKTWKQFRCPKTIGLINKSLFVHMVEYYTIMKMDVKYTGIKNKKLIKKRK